MATVLPAARQLGISGGRLSVQYKIPQLNFTILMQFTLSESFNFVSLNVDFKTFLPFAGFPSISFEAIFKNLDQCNVYLKYKLNSARGVQ